MQIITNHEAIEVRKEDNGQKTVVARDRNSGNEVKITVDEILVATGRAPNTDILHPERAGIKTDTQGWILVDEFLETSQPNIWAFGDANGKYLLKHVANYESGIVYLNAILKEKVKADYHVNFIVKASCCQIRAVVCQGNAADPVSRVVYPGKISFMVKEIDIIIGASGSHILGLWSNAHTIDYTACFSFPDFISVSVKEINAITGTTGCNIRAVSGESYTAD